MAPILVLPVRMPLRNVTLHLLRRGEEGELISASRGWPCDTFDLWDAAEGTPYWLPAQGPGIFVLIVLALSGASQGTGLGQPVGRQATWSRRGHPS